MITKESFYIQYHNADKLGYFPADGIKPSTLVKDIELKNDDENDFWIYTSKKKSVERSIGSRCFLIVGKTENKIKNYYLWSYFEIQDYREKDTEIIDVYGKGNYIKHPVYLNNLLDFNSFKKFCGNFGIGFQNITNHIFSKTLDSYVNNIDTEKSIKIVSQKLNDIINIVPSERKTQEIERIIRNDRKIVTLLKELVNYKCQFPNCNSHIPDRKGINYVEVAHITPVHKGGQSILANLIVFCPNHHKEFDLGIRQILEDNTKIISGTLNGVNFKIDLNNNYSYNMEE